MRAQAYFHIRNETCPIAYITPEMFFRNEEVRSMIKKLWERDRIARFVIDEAHCIVQVSISPQANYKN